MVPEADEVRQRPHSEWYVSVRRVLNIVFALVLSVTEVRSCKWAIQPERLLLATEPGDFDVQLLTPLQRLFRTVQVLFDGAIKLIVDRDRKGIKCCSQRENASRICE